MESLGFSKFRELLDKCSGVTREMDDRDRLGKLLDGQGFSVFFQKGGSIFGAPEESRIIFARMKSPGDDTPPEWIDQANFLAINLDDMANGRGVQSVFGAKDLPEIKVIDQGRAVDEITGKDKKKKKK